MCLCGVAQSSRVAVVAHTSILWPGRPSSMAALVGAMCCTQAHTMLCGVVQAESIKLSDKHFDSAVSWYEKAISFLPEDERAKPVKQQIQVCWLRCTMAALLRPDAHRLVRASSLLTLNLLCAICSMVAEHLVSSTVLKAELPARLCSQQHKPRPLRANTA